MGWPRYGKWWNMLKNAIKKWIVKNIQHLSHKAWAGTC